MKQIKARKSKTKNDMAQRLTDMSYKNYPAFSSLLNQISDSYLSLILRMRHGYGWTWPVIHYELKDFGLYYSLRHVFRLYAKALDEVEKILKEKQ